MFNINNKNMNNLLTYKGYVGTVNFSADDNVFFGKIDDINDLITFEGETVQELKNAFQYMVDEHIKDSENENITVVLPRRTVVAKKTVRRSFEYA